jgi:hypothetical protein
VLADRHSGHMLAQRLVATRQYDGGRAGRGRCTGAEFVHMPAVSSFGLNVGAGPPVDRSYMSRVMARL